jgi:flagellar biosynthesis/type III secretory pathway M-ring protein FliF/YscJ
MMTAMSQHPHRHSRWRRYFRENQKIVFAGVLLIVIMAFVVLLFWALTSSRFAKFN